MNNKTVMGLGIIVAGLLLLLDMTKGFGSPEEFALLQEQLHI